MKNIIILLFCLMYFICKVKANETTIIIEEISLLNKEESLLNDIINTPVDNDFYYMTNYKPLNLLSQKDVEDVCHKINQTISFTTKYSKISQNIQI